MHRIVQLKWHIVHLMDNLEVRQLLGGVLIVQCCPGSFSRGVQPRLEQAPTEIIPMVADGVQADIISRVSDLRRW